MSWGMGVVFFFFFFVKFEILQNSKKIQTNQEKSGKIGEAVIPLIGS